MKNKEIVVILDNIRSRENVGSIFRTADAAGVSKVYLCGITPCPPHDKISKSSLGADSMVPWEYHKQTWRVIKKLNQEGYATIALELGKGSENIFSTNFNNSVALVVGNEVSGLSSTIIKLCEKKVAIPMYGQKESLNVAVATGIALYALKSV
jgi:23S rRNA (guanosine2251-2'-O)-methyltransferase